MKSLIYVSSSPRVWRSQPPSRFSPPFSRRLPCGYISPRSFPMIIRFKMVCFSLSGFAYQMLHNGIRCMSMFTSYLAGKIPISDRERERESQRVRESESQRVRESESQRVRESESQRERERERESERERENRLIIVINKTKIPTSIILRSS